MSAARQNNDSAVIQTDRETGVSFAPSLIAYREVTNNGFELDSEHGWIPGVGAKASTYNALKITNLLLEIAYEFNHGSSKHWSKPP